MPSRHSTGRPRAESVAARPIQRTPTKPNIRSPFLTRDNGHLQQHRPGPDPGEYPKGQLVVAIMLGDPSIRGVDASSQKDSTPAGVRDPRIRVLRTYQSATDERSMPLTVQEFRDIINSDGPQSKALMNRIICSSSSITGTRAFWTARGSDPDDVFGDDADVERTTFAQSTVSIAPSTRLPNVRTMASSWRRLAVQSARVSVMLDEKQMIRLMSALDTQDRRS
ncbi:hypothetical protein E4U59_005447 [Claviceps monticola]|nr:hypothetical protein E4U59_005447 [Claviceps monticola]